MLRYQENNQLHKDFHGNTDSTIRYLAERYGEDVVKSILRKTGHDVYKSIREKLEKDDPSELIEHLVWFFKREGAEFDLKVTENEIRFEVFECPAHKHLRKLGLKVTPMNCLQTSEVNAGICEGTPWTSSVEHIGEDHCVQIFRKEAGK